MPTGISKINTTYLLKKKKPGEKRKKAEQFVVYQGADGTGSVALLNPCTFQVLTLFLSCVGESV